MKTVNCSIEDVKRVEPDVFGDSRGYFMETYQTRRHAEALGTSQPFVQDNLSFSNRGVLRGMHYQLPNAQGKLVQVLQGEIFDVAVDIRAGSPTFGHWVGEYLNADDHSQLWVPPGFAHGFCVLSENALFMYKCTDYYAPDCERGLRWDDPDLAIDWPIEPTDLSNKDLDAPMLKDISETHLPRYEPGS